MLTIKFILRIVPWNFFKLFLLCEKYGFQNRYLPYFIKITIKYRRQIIKMSSCCGISWKYGRTMRLCKMSSWANPKVLRTKCIYLLLLIIRENLSTPRHAYILFLLYFLSDFTRNRQLFCLFSPRTFPHC